MATAFPSPRHPLNNNHQPQTTTTAPFPTPHTIKIIHLPPHHTPTQILLLPFTDRILITITQSGRLSQWLQVPLTLTLTNPSSFTPTNHHEHPTFPDTDLSSSSFDQTSTSQHTSLLPIPSLTPTTLMGAGNHRSNGSDAHPETWARLIASQIASAILTRDPSEERTLVVGLGVDFKTMIHTGDTEGDQAGREAWLELVEGVMGVLSG